MPYEKPGSISVTFEDGSQHEFTSIEKCAGLDPADVVETSEVLYEISETSEYPVQSKTISAALTLKADLQDGKVPSSQLPSYVDDIIEVADYASLPATGEAGKIYITIDNGKQYRWSGTGYAQVGGLDAYQPFGASWVTNSTTKAFCDSVNADSTAIEGMAYLGELTCSDLPFNGNADTVAEIMQGSGTSNKVIHLIITSGNVAPYRWEYTYWNNGSNVSGWIGFQPELSAGDNISLLSNTVSVTGKATTQDVNRLFETEYPITATVTNGTVSGDASIWTGETAEVTIVPNSGCTLPDTITVSGATHSYDSSTGVATLSNVVSNVAVEAVCIKPVVLGVSGEAQSNGSLVRTDDAIGLTYNINSSTGVIASDFDNVFPYKDIVEVTDSDNNVFVRIPKHYTKYEYDSVTNTMTTRISDVQGDGYILNPCFKYESGNEIPYCYVGKCQATGTSSKATPVSGATTLASITHGNMRTACKANGTGYGMLDYWTWRMLQDLFKIEFATTNSQSVMRGNVSGSKQNSGQCDSLGQNKSGWNTTSMCMCYRGIENLYGNVNQWCDGMTFDNHNIYVCYDPTQYKSGTHNSPYVKVSYKINPNRAGNPSKRGYDSNNPIVWESVETNGSDYDTGGYWYDYATNGTSPCPYVGGNYISGSLAGLWYVYASSSSIPSVYVGGRLMFRGTL